MLAVQNTVEKYNRNKESNKLYFVNSSHRFLFTLINWRIVFQSLNVSTAILKPMYWPMQTSSLCEFLGVILVE